MPQTRPAKTSGKTTKWSQHVTETSDAMDLKPDVFKLTDPKAIARSLKTSAEHSDRRKAEPYRSAMSMLTFYVNRAGHNLEAAQKTVLERAKDELRVLFDRKPSRPAAKARDSRGRAAKKATTSTKSKIRRSTTRRRSTSAA